MSILEHVGRLRRPEQVFLVALALFGALQITGAMLTLRLAVGLVLIVTGVWAGAGLLRRAIRLATWRLRNRLIVSYLFIAVVPVLLVVALAARAAREIAGQLAVYLVHSEFERRVANLRSPAQALARTPAVQRAQAVQRLGALFRERFPGLEVLLRGEKETIRFPADARIEPPPEGWQDTSGVMVKGGFLYEWARAVGTGVDVTVVVPITRSLLEDLSPGLGEVSIVQFGDTASPAAPGRVMRLHEDLDGDAPKRRAGIPEPVNRFDFEFSWATNLPVAVWEAPQTTSNALLGVHSRISAVLRAISSRSAEWRPLLVLLYTIAIVFLLVEVVSIVVGVSITRAITGAVHDLYEGTQRVQAGDFRHRIPVHGDDQVAELSRSFNTMTENLERLLVVAKEKERLQADLEIAREVQNQLYPRSAPMLERFRLQAVCHPARVVSGDYYDYQALPGGRAAIAVADVAGKGISAALLMATLQSSLRMQLRSSMERAAAAGAAASYEVVSTSEIVSHINQHLYANTAPEKYATFFFAMYDAASSVLTYTNAGHLPPMLLRRGEVTPLDVNGMVVGAFPFARYGESRLHLESGDLLLCYTDGVTEPENEYSEMFGEARLVEVLTKNAHREPEEIARMVIESVERFTGSPELQDDLTLLLARRL
jgi:sigma-B regulation protein RsbU (phosphoserine phosphatase)